MKKLLLIAILGGTVGNAWAMGARPELDEFSEDFKESQKREIAKAIDGALLAAKNVSNWKYNAPRLENVISLKSAALALNDVQALNWILLATTVLEDRSGYYPSMVENYYYDTVKPALLTAGFPSDLYKQLP